MRAKMTRRDFLTKGAQAALGAIAITACGDIFALGTAKKMEIGEIIVKDDEFIIETERLKEVEAINFVYKGKKSILLFNNGNIKAFENICTHKGGPSKLRGNKLVCEWHGAQFNPVTGEAIKGPAPTGSSLPSINVDIQGGKIFVR